MATDPIAYLRSAKHTQQHREKGSVYKLIWTAATIKCNATMLILYTYITNNLFCKKLEYSA